MKFCVFDIECDGLLDTVTKIHCLNARIYEGSTLIKIVNVTNPLRIPEFLSQQETIVGHNIILYDLPAIEKVLGYKHRGICIDTLGLSWYLYPERKEHGLESWGEYYGVPKPVIKSEEWKGPLPGESWGMFIAKMIHRCSEDVKINALLFQECLEYLGEIYRDNSIIGIIRYLTWKLECAAEQQENPLTIDRAYCQVTLKELEGLVEEKVVALKQAMPRIVKYVEKTKPAKMFTVKGDLTKAYQTWLELLADNDLEADFEGSVSIIKSSEEPKPNSPVQLKTWLYSLGWVPTIYKPVHDERVEGNKRYVPQLQDDDKRLCPNIRALEEDNPAITHLKGLFMLQHRVGVLKGFLECSDENGKMVASIAGFTNTLRFKHKKPIANLPSVGKPYGKEIRGAIIAPSKDHIFCGSDMSSLEDTTKQHYMYFYDPDYVTAMRVPGFDPHLDIAVLSGMLTRTEVAMFKVLDKKQDMSPSEVLEYARLKKIRTNAKVVNFSGVYGAGPSTIAVAAKLTLQEATTLHTIYWERNKAVKQIARDTIHKVVRKQMWLYNPVSGFWYSLRKEKDKFSTLNQGTGVYCFDTHIRNVRNEGVVINLQYHDEVGFSLIKEDKELTREKLNRAIDNTNKMLCLNVPLGISVDFGLNYAETH